MADLNFPTNPAVGDSYTIGSRTWVWNGTAWQLQSAVQSLDPFTVKTLIVTSSTNSTSTNSGAVIIEGGVGIGGDLWVGGDFYAGGQAVLTTASFFAAISEGTDIRITEGTTGTVIISNTSTLQSVTSRGATTTNVITINNFSSATSTNTGALIVSGGVGIGNDLWVGGNIFGNIVTVVNTSTNANNVSVVQQTNNADHYLTFVDSNNSSLSYESVYTTSSLVINPSTGNIDIKSNLFVSGIINIQKTVVNPSAVLIDTLPVILDSFSTTQYRSAKYFISISNTATNQFQTSEIWLVQDGNAASIEQTSVFSSATNYVVVFSTDVSTGTVSLIAEGVAANNRVKIQSTYIAV
jgi:hypothetical protein